MGDLGRRALPFSFVKIPIGECTTASDAGVKKTTQALIEPLSYRLDFSFDTALSQTAK
jgi:hypothetical protein